MSGSRGRGSIASGARALRQLRLDRSHLLHAGAPGRDSTARRWPRAASPVHAPGVPVPVGGVAPDCPASPRRSASGRNMSISLSEKVSSSFTFNAT